MNNDNQGYAKQYTESPCVCKLIKRIQYP